MKHNTKYRYSCNVVIVSITKFTWPFLNYLLGNMLTTHPQFYTILWYLEFKTWIDFISITGLLQKRVQSWCEGPKAEINLAYVENHLHGPGRLCVGYRRGRLSPRNAIGPEPKWKAKEREGELFVCENYGRVALAHLLLHAPCCSSSDMDPSCLLTTEEGESETKMRFQLKSKQQCHDHL